MDQQHTNGKVLHPVSTSANTTIHHGTSTKRGGPTTSDRRGTNRNSGRLHRPLRHQTDTVNADISIFAKTVEVTRTTSPRVGQNIPITGNARAFLHPQGGRKF